MAVPPEQAEVAGFLAGLAGTAVLETHISAIFRGTDTVWKLKKAVRLTFLDFSTLAARRHFAERELALNAPAAPGLYRDVVAVVRGPDGALALETAPGPGVTVLDWVLRMARIPDGAFLDQIAAAGALPPALLDELGDVVADYHLRLAPLADRDPAEAMRGVIASNEQAALATDLPAERVRAWQIAAQRALAAQADWLRARGTQGFVRRAHGDLHLGNLCLWQGKVAPFDALEFDEALATIDLGYDLAFLLMDLEQRAGRAAANRVMNRYVARTGDAALVRFLPVFLSSRALIRAHVVARTRGAAEALPYLDAAEGYLRPDAPVLVAVGGLPGTGKSTLARGLAPGLGRAPGALVLRSDEIRKRLHGVAPEMRLPAEAYAESVSARVFATLAAEAGVALSGGQAVVADATFLDATHRALLAAAAAQAGVKFIGLWLTAPVAELEARIGARTGDASDATVAVLRAAVARGDGPSDWATIDASDAAAALRDAREIMRAGAGLC